MHAYWRAANYLTVGQIYLQDNPLLREPAARTLGDVSRPEPRLRPPEPAHPGEGCERHLPGRPGTRGSRHPGERVPRGRLFGGLPCACGPDRRGRDDRAAHARPAQRTL